MTALNNVAYTLRLSIFHTCVPYFQLHLQQCYIRYLMVSAFLVANTSIPHSFKKLRHYDVSTIHVSNGKGHEPHPRTNTDTG